MNVWKKILNILIIILIIITLIKASILLFENFVLDKIKSKNFHNFLVNRLEYHVTILADEIEQGKRPDLKNAIKKIQDQIK